MWTVRINLSGLCANFLLQRWVASVHTKAFMGVGAPWLHCALLPVHLLLVGAYSTTAKQRFKVGRNVSYGRVLSCHGGLGVR